MARPFILSHFTFATLGLLLVMLFFSLQQAMILRPGLMHPYEVEHTLLAGDYRTIWTQLHLAATGRPEVAYDGEVFFDIIDELTNFPKIVHGHPAFYPPHFAFLLEPLGKLGFAESWRIYSWGLVIMVAAATLLAFPKQPYGALLVTGSPALWISLQFGQTTMLLTILYLILLALRSPAGRGTCLALATFKPHLGVMTALVLLWQKQWSTIFYAVSGTLLLLLLTWLHFGSTIFIAYADVILSPFQRISSFSDTQSHFMISIYGSLRQLGIPALPAALIHLVPALFALCLLLQICKGRAMDRLSVAAALTTTLIVIPHVYVYDMALLLIPFMVIVMLAQQRGWQPDDAIAVLPLYALPFFVESLNRNVQLPLVPLLLLLLLSRLAQHSRLQHG